MTAPYQDLAPARPFRGARRRARALTAGAAALLLAGGCAQGTSDTESEASFDAEAALSGPMRVMGFAAVDEIASVRLERAQEALGEEVEVELVEGDLDIQQFLSAVAAGDPPAVVYADRGQIGTFASRGAILPLGDCIDGEGIDTDPFVDSAVEQVTFDGEVYGIPEFNTVQIIQADARLLRQAGLGVAEVNGSDWEALSQANRALSRREGGRIRVIGFDSKLPEFLPLWAHANGGRLISEDGRTATLDDPAVVEALEFAVSIYEDQGGFGAVKAIRDSADFFGDENQFATHTLGAMPMEQWYVNVLNEVSPDVEMAFDTVRDREGGPVAYASGSAWAIPKGSPNPEAACRLARVMTETDSWLAAAEERARLREADDLIFTGVLTGNEEADEQIQQMTTGEGTPWEAAVAATYDANENTFALPANPAGEEFEAAWQDGVNRVLNGQQSPDEAMARAQEEAQQALDEAWAEWDG